ncbi:MAG: cyclic nucleotide-binding domain-containing protein, partial [Planctomycetota bacterium]|nr:cyclic nucleotide-binding domain-containing protein [Planctomycetota bacterium]
LLWGIPLLDYFPVMVLGGLLLFLGMAFMREWVWDAKSRLSLVDYLLLIAIWILIAFLGFIQGVSAGLLVAMVIFIINYSRTKVVKLEFSGALLRSNRERPPEESAILDKLGQHIQVFKLQGFVFFGTANNLLEQYRHLFEKESGPEIRFVIFDFRAITGIDSSAVASFRQMIQLSTTKGSHLLFADVPDSVARILDSNDLRQATIEQLGAAPHLDHCLEWCEDKLLSERRSPLVERSFATVLAEIFTKEEIERFREKLEKRELAEGEVLCKEGAPSDSLFFIEHGQVAASVLDLDGLEERLRSLGSGAIIGEMGLYTKAPRSATLTAVEATTLFVLSRESLNQIQREDPLLATTFHCYIAQILAGRLGQANNTLKFLLK